MYSVYEKKKKVIMTGINLMLMSLCIIYNSTNCSENYNNFNNDKRHDWEINLDTIDLSIAKQNLKSKNENLIPKIMKITTLDVPPYSSIYRLNGKIFGNLTSYAFYVFDLISKKMNITYEIIMPNPETLGDNKNGVIGLLNEGKVDMAVAFLPINPDMYPYISYSPMLTQIELKAMMRRPDNSAIGSGLLAPFTSQVWILIVIAVIVSGPIFFIIIFMRCYLWKPSKIDNYTFLQCAWFTYGAILKQGSVIIPKTDSNRVLFASWWIFITILTSFYTANLTAFLTLSEFTLPYHSINDIVKDNQKWTSTSEHYIDYALKQSTIEELESLKISYKNNYGRFINNPSDSEMLKIMFNEKKIYLGEGNDFERILVNDYLERVQINLPQKERCKYVIMPEVIYKQPVGFAYPKNSIYQEKFDKQLRILVETGIFKHLEQIKLPAIQYCPLNLNSIERKLKMNDLSLTYKIIAGGFTLATLLLIYEKTGLCQKNKINKNCSCSSSNCKICKKNNNIRKPTFTRENIKNPRFIYPVNNYFNNYPNIGNPSPIYQSINTSKRTIFNGRDYLEIDLPLGGKRLIPTRSPSALLFQYYR